MQDVVFSDSNENSVMISIPFYGAKTEVDVRK